MAARDDDDWVAEPPEGRHAAGRARPGFWQQQWQARAALSILGVVVILAALVVLLLA
jgi:hypothetical protein